MTDDETIGEGDGRTTDDGTIDETVEAQNEETIRRLLDETHRGNFEVLDEAVAEDVTTHGFFGMDATDREGYRRFFENFGAAFGDQEFEVKHLIAEGDLVVAHFAISADHQGTVMGLEPTGKRLSWTGTAVYRFEDGKLAEVWLYPDFLAIFRQLDLLPDELEE